VPVYACSPVLAYRQLARTRYVGSFALENGRECWLGKALPLTQRCTISLLKCVSATAATPLLLMLL
jgi:hypothetical protein